MKNEDVLGFVRNFFRTVEALPKFMLDPEGLILYPEFLFWDRGGRSRFCYLPTKERPLNEEFRSLAEQFEERMGEKTKRGFCSFIGSPVDLTENF